MIEYFKCKNCKKEIHDSSPRMQIGKIYVSRVTLKNLIKHYNHGER